MIQKLQKTHTLLKLPNLTNYGRLVIILLSVLLRKTSPLASMLFLFVDINIIRNLNYLVAKLLKYESYFLTTANGGLAFGNRLISIIILLEFETELYRNLYLAFIFVDYIALAMGKTAEVYMKKGESSIESHLHGANQRLSSGFDHVIEAYFSVFLLFNFLLNCLKISSDILVIGLVLAYPSFIIITLIKLLEFAYGFWYVYQQDLKKEKKKEE